MLKEPQTIQDLAARGIVSDLVRYVSDLAPARVEAADALLLGSVDGPGGVQAVDLGLVVEVLVEDDARSALSNRLAETYLVLGTRRVPRGTAYACAVPPRYVSQLGRQTFTIVVRADAGGHFMLYPPKHEEGNRGRAASVGVRRQARGGRGRAGSGRRRPDRRRREAQGRAGRSLGSGEANRLD